MLTESRSEEVSEPEVPEVQEVQGGVGGAGEGRRGMFRRSCSAASVPQVPLGGDQDGF